VDEVEAGGRRLVRVVRAGGRPPLTFPVWVTAPAAVANLPPGRSLVQRYPDLWLRVVVHHARPYSELADRLAADEADRDEQLAQVRTEIRRDMTQLRRRLGLIGAASFAALVIGGWLIVARGLRPVGKLSDAVSRVSEKDFKLPHDGTDLPAELAPIHARLTQTLDLLRRAFAREKQAVADISHELRTPIAALMATIDVTLRKPRTPEQYRATLEECRLISKQLNQLVERIMTLASLDSGNDHAQFARTDAAELVAGCAAVIRPLAAAHGVAVGLHVDEPLELDTDPGKLREVLMNLLHNAVEYNHPGGTIDLSARRGDGAVVFEVRDTGIGIPADVREKIFERFYRADPSRHATGVHAGLGLAIVKEYVTRLNGSIAVDSEPGAGSTFRVTLPAPLAGPDDEPAPARKSAPARA
jgi:signal transduction histidine kinase